MAYTRQSPGILFRPRRSRPFQRPSDAETLAERSRPGEKQSFPPETAWSATTEEMDLFQLDLSSFEERSAAAWDAPSNDLQETP